MIYPLVRDLAADGIPVTVTCRVLGFSAQAFYKWQARPVTQRDWDDAHLINAAYDIHADDPAFGYRFIADELPSRGIIAGENRVARLCSQQRIWSVFAKKRGLNRKSDPPVHDDLVARRFIAQKPNQLWLTDITEHRTACIPAIVATLVVTRLPVKHSGALQGCPSRVISGVDR
jgi:putative transposase